MLWLHRISLYPLRTSRLSLSRAISFKLPVRSFQSFQRHLATKTVAPKARSKTPIEPQKKTLFPERLLIYHAGTGRTVFLGCLKVTTIFIFTFFCLVVAPTHFAAPDQPKWVVVGVLLSGIIPMLTVAYITHPFVTYIHLRIPHFARNSREMLHRYSKTLSKDAELDVTTMNFIGKPRVARMKVGDVHPARQRFGLVNFRRDTERVEKGRKWWMGKVQGVFGVHGKGDRVRDSEVWGLVKVAIEKNGRR